MANIGNLIQFSPLAIMFAVDKCDYGVAVITGLALITIAVINKLPIGKDKK